jgi:hypothetical protein
MSGVAGLRGTGDWGTDERPKDFRESILFFSPNGDSPIFALTSKAGKKTVSDPEFSWWAESQNHVRLTNSVALTATDTTITVAATSIDPTATQMANLYGTATHLKAGDILQVEPATDSSVYTPEFLEVTGVISDTSFTVTRGAAGTTAVSQTATAAFTLISSAYAEGTPAPRAVSRNPVKFFNYTQIFKNTYEISGTADATTARTGSAWSNDKKRKSFDHARNIEMSMLFGLRAETTDPVTGKPKRFMGSMRSFIPPSNTTVFGTAVTAALFSDAIAPAFDFDMGGGDTRIGFCGNFARTEIGKVIQATTGIKIELGNPVKMFGINFQEFILPMGRLLLKSHPLLSRHPLWKKSLFVLDFSAVKYVALKGRDTKTQDDVQTKDEDVRRGFIQTECSMMVDGGGLSCAYLGNISAT